MKMTPKLRKQIEQLAAIPDGTEIEESFKGAPFCEFNTGLLLASDRYRYRAKPPAEPAVCYRNLYWNMDGEYWGSAYTEAGAKKAAEDSVDKVLRIAVPFYEGGRDDE